MSLTNLNYALAEELKEISKKASELEKQGAPKANIIPLLDLQYGDLITDGNSIWEWKGPQMGTAGCWKVGKRNG